MKKIMLILLVLVNVGACVRTHDKLEKKNPNVIPPSYGQRPEMPLQQPEDKKPVRR